MNVFLQIFNNRFLAFLVPAKQPFMLKSLQVFRYADHSNSRPKQHFSLQNMQLSNPKPIHHIFFKSYARQCGTRNAHTNGTRNISGH